MAVSRAGQLALDFKYRQSRGPPSLSVVDAVAQYFHRFRSFRWTLSAVHIDISRPAPLLREFCFDDWMCFLPKDFLGGAVGALRTLDLDDVVFPENCPSLATVTDLRVKYPPSVTTYRRFHVIFDLCPRLEILDLHGSLVGAPGIVFPASPAPRTLRKVTLCSYAMCNLGNLYAVWGLEFVQDVHIRAEFDASLSIDPFMDGVVALSVLFEGTQHIRVSAQLSGGRVRKLTCGIRRSVRTPGETLADMVLASTVLSHMHTISAPLSVLGHALAGAYHWPQLAHLNVHLYAANTFQTHPDRAPRLCLSHLNCLRAAPMLESLTLHMHTLDDASGPRCSLSATFQHYEWQIKVFIEPSLPPLGPDRRGVRFAHTHLVSLVSPLMMPDIARRLPPEVLAACFAFLDLGELVSASHVSQSWRTAALSFPDLWSSIVIFAHLGKSGRLLHMAVSRAGQLPLDFEYTQMSPMPTQSMLKAVSQYFPRFRSFKWTCYPGYIDISRPAPLLRELGCSEWMCSIPRDFLGGRAGALRTLHLDDAVFPETCPALARVTDLRARYPEFADDGRRFHYIFDLCPRLEVLHLRDLDGAPGGELPAGPAPRTLRKVALDAWTSCDLLQLYAVWGLEAVADVQLRMPLGASVRIAPFIDGAVELSLLFEGDQEAVHIVAELSDGRTRKLTGDDVGDPVAVLAEMLQDGAALSHMQRLIVPLSVLGRALAGAHHWPALSHLIVHIYADDMHPDGAPRSSWAHLNCLRSAPALESLALHIHAPNMVTVDDARNIREHLSTLTRCILREVQVYGFPKAVVREMRARDDDGPRILFHEVSSFSDGTLDPRI
ncbi:hypothetical protein AURDEDRAFT_187242 [Auricularia subglabra TFB-10046 SS5]|uniref:F-box domain-containing protein n=1 Tax=Auricularia subglabra (strain TFB-10046 / SS5) TaxID=717982 RepID=J0WW64_AURST|nr:hypothetical protein AURDEDRAFT_187242 [Auricularia subglabra TFB-10046 SS5]